LRESPTVDLIEKLIGKGYIVEIYDNEVAFAKIFGANKKYIEHVIPHISCLIKDSVQQVIDDTDLIVVGKKSPEFSDIVTGLDKSKVVIDLVRILSDAGKYHGNYEGICW